MWEVSANLNSGSSTSELQLLKQPTTLTVPRPASINLACVVLLKYNKKKPEWKRPLKHLTKSKRSCRFIDCVFRQRSIHQVRSTVSMSLMDQLSITSPRGTYTSFVWYKGQCYVLHCSLLYHSVSCKAFGGFLGGLWRFACERLCSCALPNR